MSELAILYPAPEMVRVGKRMVAIKAVEFQHFDAFGKAAGELLVMLANASPEQVYDWAKRSGALNDVLATCTSLSRWRIKRLPATVVVELMMVVIKVNNGFFAQALAAAANR